jgi:single-stranded-DNA-specific exonuclease
MEPPLLESAPAPALPLSRWKIKERLQGAEAKLQLELGIPRVVAALLVQRGITEPEAAADFLNPKLEDLHAPNLLPDYEPAVKAILGAKERDELIYVHGDYDVDGVTSAAMLTRYLTRIGCRVEVKVPNRFKDGYGVNLESVREAAAMGAKLFLTCDCGISAHEGVELAHELGMKVVVTDHHTVSETLPSAEAVVNPHRRDSEYPFTHLSGAGIAFKLCDGITQELGHPRENFWRAYLDLAVLGTVADVMPLTGENRIIARFGLDRLADSKKPGIAALMRASGLMEKLAGKKLKAWHIGFVLGPRLNAAGRIEDATLALSLLLSQDETEAYHLAKKLEELNTNRKAEQEQLIEEAIERVVATGADKHACIVVSGEGWHSGVLGIVAGRLREKFCRPVFVLTVNPETGRASGSGRSVPGVHLADAIRSFPDLLEGGGHAAAAGISLSAERLDEAQDALHGFASQFLTEEDFIPCTEPDLEVEAGEITLPCLEALAKLEPFGTANPEPTFVCRQVAIDQIIPTRNPDHPQLMIRASGAPAMRAPAFGMGSALASRSGGFNADVLFRASMDDYNGLVRVKWEIKDLAPIE